MLKKSLLSTLVLGALCSVSVSALAAAPTECPSVDVIKAEKLTIIDQVAQRCHNNGHQSSPISASVNIGTDPQWVFTLSGIKVKHKEDAQKAVDRALKSLKGNPTPALDEASQTYVCLYTVNHGLQAVATTAAKSEPVNTDPVNTDPVNTDPVNTDPVNSDAK